MAYKDPGIEAVFPKLNGDYQITSPIDNRYNCIAFAAGDVMRWWWPQIHFWPSGVPERDDLDSFVACFESLGYKQCGMDDGYEPGYEKVAIYVNPIGGKPTHAAKQCLDGKGLWKSKLGLHHDIEHILAGLTGTIYGDVAVIMRRPLA